MSCKDPYVESLHGFGYNVIRLPRADVRPLQLLAKEGGGLNRIGELTTVLRAGPNVPLPKVTENTRMAAVSGGRSGDLSFGIGVSVLGSLIGAMGGSKLGLDLTYRNAKSVTFEFPDVLEDRVEVARLDQYLADADVSPFAAHVGRLLDADQLYVTTAILKATKITVDARRSDDTGLDVSVPEIQKVVGGNVKVGGKAEVTSKVTYEGSVPLAFAFQTVRLFYEDGHYQRFELLPDSTTMVRGLPRRAHAPVLGEGAFVRLGESRGGQD
jgi:hypothetical protein